MSLEKLIDKFLDKTGYLENDKVRAIVVYGSRVKGTNKNSSDLDILVITEQNKNFRLGMFIEGVNVDVNIYSSRDLFDVAYDKKRANNNYFVSVLKTGIVIKNDGILEELSDYLDELADMRFGKKKLSLEVFAEIKSIYENFISTKSLYWYFNLLEKLRMTYNYLKNCSYISSVKVYEIFRNCDYYQDAYSLKLPDAQFISLFLDALSVIDFDIQVSIIRTIMNNLGIDINRSIDYFDDTEKFFNDNDIKSELLVIYNKVEKVVEFLKENHPYADYAYNVLLRHIYLFYKRIYRTSSKDIDDSISKANSISNEERIKTLEELFGIVEKDYHFDYDNYMLKLMV